MPESFNIIWDDNSTGNNGWSAFNDNENGHFISYFLMKDDQCDRSNLSSLYIYKYVFAKVLSFASLNEISEQGIYQV